MPTPPAPTGSNLEVYQQYRMSVQTLQGKIIQQYLERLTVTKAAETLRLKKANSQVLLFGSEIEQAALFDFALFEVLDKGGQNVIQRYTAEVGGQNKLERNLLAGMVQAQTGLFIVREPMPHKHQVILQNMIDPTQTMALTDINLSQSALQGGILFIRPVPLPEMVINGGFMFVFNVSWATDLVQQWHKLTPKGSARRYAWFFLKNRQSGYETEVRHI